MAFRTLILENQCRCTYQSGYMVVRTEDASHKIHLGDIDSVLLATEQAFLSAYLLAELAKAEVSVVFSDDKYNPVGQMLPLHGAHNAMKCIEKQIQWGEVRKKAVWRVIVTQKIHRQAELLDILGHEKEAKILKVLASDVHSKDNTNREAQAARTYFTTLFGEGFSRDADTSLNASLNYGYTILLSRVNREIAARGYLTQQGIFHHNEYNLYNLSCDFMEPFRPVYDMVISEQYACDFDTAMRRTLVNVANRCIQYRGGNYKVSSVVSLFVQQCLQVLNKTIEADEIEEFSLTALDE